MKTKDPKRIVIDARMIDVSTGIYIQGLLHFLNKDHAHEFAFIVLVPSKTLEKWTEMYPNLTLQAADEKSYSVAEQTRFVGRLESYDPDLVHFTMPQQPFLWLRPSVTTIHDLTLVRYDNIDMNKYVYKVKKGIFISLIRTVIMRSKAILTPTQFVKDDIIDYMGKRYADKIHVTLEAGDPLEVEPEPITKLEGKHFLFFVGNAFPYKNIERIIKAFEKLKKTQPELQLVLAGKRDFFYRQHEKFVRERAIPDVHFLGYISDGEKRWALQNCAAYVTASLSEGFNIPLLEAMYEGAPVVASDASCHREVAGLAALFFDPLSTDDAAAKISALLSDGRLRDQLTRRGKKRVEEFSWQKMARDTVAVYRTVLK